MGNSGGAASIGGGGPKTLGAVASSKATQPDFWAGVGAWIEENQSQIVGTVAGIAAGVGATAGCLVLTAGAGSVGCLIAGSAVGGAVAGAVTNPWSAHVTRTQEFSWVSLAVDVGMGALFGAAGGAAGVGIGAVISRVAAPTVQQAITAIRGALRGTPARPYAHGNVLSAETSSSASLYRGVPAGHPGYSDAAHGVVRPIGGHSSPALHNGGNTFSEYTSWSTDEWIARGVAAEGNAPGIVMRIPNADGVGYTRVASPDIYGESEVLIRGVVRGAEVLPWEP